jgi:hypothetical protein
MGGRLTDELVDLDLQKLETLVASSAAGKSVETLDTEDDERVEVSVE